MNQKLLTISIAAYNKENYIRECLDSLIIPEILDDLEVFVIDDGGTDSTYDIAKEYEKKYPNTFKVIHKENCGYGSTVNYSIEHATGKYFKLLDGDDYFDKIGFSSLMSAIKKECIYNDIDVIFTLFSKVYEDKKITAVKFKNQNIGKILNIEDIDEKQGFPMHTLTYRTDVLRKSGVILKEHILFSDNYYVSIPFFEVKKVFFKSINVYCYRQDVVGQSVDLKILDKHKDVIKEISLDLCKFYEEHKSNCIKLQDYIRYRIASTCDDYIATVFKSNSFFKACGIANQFSNDIRKVSTDIYDMMPHVDRTTAYLVKLSRLLVF